MAFGQPANSQGAAFTSPGKVFDLQHKLANLQFDNAMESRIRVQDPGSRFHGFDRTMEQERRAAQIEQAQNDVRQGMARLNMQRQMEAPYAQQIHQNTQARALGYNNFADQQNQEAQRGLLASLADSFRQPLASLGGQAPAATQVPGNHRMMNTQFMGSDGRPAGGIFRSAAPKSPVAGLL